MTATHSHSKQKAHATAPCKAEPGAVPRCAVAVPKACAELRREKPRASLPAASTCKCHMGPLQWWRRVAVSQASAACKLCCSHPRAKAHEENTHAHTRTHTRRRPRKVTPRVAARSPTKALCHLRCARVARRRRRGNPHMMEGRRAQVCERRACASKPRETTRNHAASRQESRR